MSRWAALGLALAFNLSGLTAAAEPAPPAQLGRIAAVAGTVSIEAAPNAAPLAAVLNTPLIAGNAVVTKPRSHATVDIGAGRLQLDGDTRLEIAVLDSGNSTVNLKSGAVILHILPGGEGQVFSVATPQGVLHALQPGAYEVEVVENLIRASALDGGAQFEGIVLRGGTRISLDDKQAPALDAAVEDDFVRRIAAEMEEGGEGKSEAPQHVSAQITGFQDLTKYGLWVASEKYGWVWEPQVASDWAPFRDGRWVEIAGLGRTWIDDAPWGFATAHYGSWAEVNGRWVWNPGNAAQAEVNVLGAQSGGNHSGWVALGPEEQHPTASSPIIITNVRVVAPPPPKVVNVTTVNNTTNVTNVVHDDHEPSLVVIGTPVINPPPSPPPSQPSSSIPNRTGLGAAGTPIGAGVSFPGAQ